MPSKLSTICSKHFLEGDFILSNKGKRYVKSTAIPSMKIVKIFDQQQSVNLASVGSSKKRKINQSHKSFNDTHKVEQNCKQEPDDDIPMQFRTDSPVQFKEERPENTDVTTTGSNCSSASPITTKLQMQLMFCKNKIIKQGLKIKQLQSRNRRLKKKLNNMDDVLLRLEKKCTVTKENLDLKNTSLEV